jgi:acid phosphatase (class A)
MRYTKLLFILTLFATSAFAQQHKLEAVSDHYKTLRQFSAGSNQQRASMDTIKYPPKEYSGSITFLLVKPYYLSDAQVKALSESVKFPANSSDQTRKELDYMLDLQSKRTPEQIKRVTFLGDIGYWPQIKLVPTHLSYQQNLIDLFFEGREVIGDNMTAKNFPKISKLLGGVMQDMRIMEFTIKYKLLRPRPYHLESKLEPLTRINSPSFASGHTLWAFTQAFTWSEVIPEKSNAFISLAEEIRRSREIMGIHFPSDNEAARQVAYNMLQYYFKNDNFLKDLKEAKAEWQSKK